MLLKIFDIDTEKINKRNDELIKMNLMDRLSIKQKKILNFYKGPPKFINDDGLYSYSDITTYLTDEQSFGKISVKNLKDYIIIYQINRDKFGIQYNEIVDQLDGILKTIQKKRIQSVVKYINIMDTVFNKGIRSTDTIYRMMSVPFNGNVIKNTTSWSLSPIEWFCNSETECHLYVTKLSKNIKVMYVENNSKDKNLKTFQEFYAYEFEYLLPRDIEFKELKTKKIAIPNPKFALKKKPINQKKEVNIIVHYIKIIKKLKSKKDELVKNIPISVATQ